MMHLECDCGQAEPHPACSGIPDHMSSLKVSDEEDDVTCPRCRLIVDYEEE